MRGGFEDRERRCLRRVFIEGVASLPAGRADLWRIWQQEYFLKRIYPVAIVGPVERGSSLAFSFGMHTSLAYTAP